MSEVAPESSNSGQPGQDNTGTPLIPLHKPEKRGKKGKMKVTDRMVITSLTSTVPIVVPETTGALEVANKKSNSAPSSPRSSGNKGKNWFIRHLPRPSSPVMPRKNSDPLDLSQSSSRPKWLGLGRKNRSRSTEAVNGGATPLSPIPLDGEGRVEFDLHSSSSSIEPEATPVATLPGQTDRILDEEIPDQHTRMYIPTITVSTHGGVGFEDREPRSIIVENGLDGEEALRKFSQSSHHSQCSTLHSNSGTSGVGSLLSPSGDEYEVVSDLESPLSPLSGASSYRGSQEEIHIPSFSDCPSTCSDNDYDKDFTVVSPSSDSETLTLATSPTGRGCSPPGGDDSGSEMPGKSTDKKKKSKSSSKSSNWIRLRKVVTAFSPFTLSFKKRKYDWVQLAGHQGNFLPGGDNGTIMKKSDDNEKNALMALMEDKLRPFVPEFRRVVHQSDNMYVEMTDLLREFVDPAVMDIKLGVRTYLELELGKKKVLRKDMYEKMIEIDPLEPTEEEHLNRAITKPRYMQWRESTSSTSTLGFRIEGIKTSDGQALKDFKTMKAGHHVLAALRDYLQENRATKESFLRRLLDIRNTLGQSHFFRTHELIGSSLLFVYDSSSQCSVHMIDFGKTVPLPSDVVIDHRSRWVAGNHEDGYLWGLDNLIELWKEI